MEAWLVLLAAGVGGLGLGIGVVVGAAINRAARGRNDEMGPDHRRH